MLAIPTCLLLTCTLLPQGAPSLRVGQPYSGEIDADSAVLKSRSIRRRFGKAGVRRRPFRATVADAGAYAIELGSKDFNPWLIVRNAEGKLLQELAGTRKHPALLIVELAAGAGVTIDACALGGKVGRFSLSVHRATPSLVARARVARRRSRLAAAEREHGPDHVRVAAALFALALDEQGVANYPEAARLYRRCLAIFDKLGGFARNRAVTQDRLARCLQAMGRWVDAERGFRRALDMMTKAQGPQHADVATALHNLAGLLVEIDRHDEARLLSERAVAIRKRLHGEKHRLVADVLDGLCGALHGLRRYAEAEAICRETLAIREAAAPEAPLELSLNLANLARICRDTNRFRQAEQLYLRALEIEEKTLPAPHPRVASTLHNLAELYHQLSRFAEAERCYLRVVKIYEASYGRESAEVARALDRMAISLRTTGRFAEAEALHRRALAIWVARRGPSHPDVAECLGFLSWVLRESGRLADAQSCQERALAILEKKHGRNHMIVVQNLSGLAILYHKARKYAAAERLLRRALAATTRTQGTENENVAALLCGLGMALAAQGKHDEAAVSLHRALAVAQKTGGEVAPILNNLGTLASDLGDFAKAEEYARRAIAAVQRRFGPDHPNVTIATENLYNLLGAVGRHSDAWSLALEHCETQLGHVLGELARSRADDRYRIAAGMSRSIEAVLTSLSHVKAPGAAGEAWQRLTSWKGLVFRVARRVTGAKGPRVSAMRARMRQVASQLAASAHARKIVDVEAHRKRHAALTEERRRLQTEFVRELGIELEREQTTAMELGKLLPERSVLIDFVVHRPYRFPNPGRDGSIGHGVWSAARVLAFVIRHGASEPKLVDLGPAAQLRKPIEGWLSSVAGKLADGKRGAPTAPSDRLGRSRSAARDVRERLWNPLARHLKSASLVFVCADDVMAQVPFGAIEVAKGRYAIEDAKFVSVQDPVTLRDHLERRADPLSVRPTLLAVGGVDYAKSEPPSSAREFARAWLPLPAAGLEVESIAKLFREKIKTAEPTLLRATEATEESFRRHAPAHSIVHLATHGFFERNGVASLWENALQRAHTAPSEPSIGDTLRAKRVAVRVSGQQPGLLAGLILAGANATPSAGRADGVLTADDVSHLDLAHCRLVVLSACETALGSVRSGEGLVSLRRAFAEAGAQTVISTLWRVDDRASRALIERFYHGLWVERLSPTEALRAAQLWMLRGDAHRDWRSPYYWAAWLSAGEWR